MREKEGVQLGGRGVGDDMRRDEGRKPEIIIYCMKNIYFQLKNCHIKAPQISEYKELWVLVNYFTKFQNIKSKDIRGLTKFASNICNQRFKCI